MGVAYVSVQWNRQKRFYDAVLVAGVGSYLALFGVVTKRLFPLVTDEIMLMRAFGTAAFLLLHIILCIGPICRLNPRFLPLLYNRRHAGNRSRQRAAFEDTQDWIRVAPGVISDYDQSGVYESQEETGHARVPTIVEHGQETGIQTAERPNA